MISRRDFLKKTVIGAAGAAIPVAALEILTPRRLQAEKDDKGKVRWVFLVDTLKCIGCGMCVVLASLILRRHPHRGVHIHP